MFLSVTLISSGLLMTCWCSHIKWIASASGFTILDKKTFILLLSFLHFDYIVEPTNINNFVLWCWLGWKPLKVLVMAACLNSIFPPARQMIIDIWADKCVPHLSTRRRGVEMHTRSQAKPKQFSYENTFRLLRSSRQGHRAAIYTGRIRNKQTEFVMFYSHLFHFSSQTIR